jgi:hypothetical protein
MKILITGDSFAADWTVKYPLGKGWVNLLAEHYDVTNVAQAGVGEYKIYQQVQQQNNIDSFDIVIISHTSPYRVHTRRHPVHHQDSLHANADLSMGDIGYHASRPKSIFNRSLWSANRFFQDHFDGDYQEEMYRLLVNSIHDRLKNIRCIQVNNFICPVTSDPKVKDFVDLSGVQLAHPGIHNHLSDAGNKLVFDIIQSVIDGKK